MAPDQIEHHVAAAGVTGCRPKYTVVFFVYQAVGMTVYDIQRQGIAGGWVVLDGHHINIRASVTSPGDYSAHADDTSTPHRKAVDKR